jgi:glycerol uptake facilitator-like aquaporin
MPLRNYWPRTTVADDVKAAFFEFIGTVMFLLLAFGATQSSHDVQGGLLQGSNLERTMYIAAAFGLSLLVSAWLFFRATGGLFNPDVSLSLLLVGCIGPIRFILYCIAQLVGAIAAAGIVLALTPGPLTFKYVLSYRCICYKRLIWTFANSQLARSPLTSIVLRLCSSKCSSPRRSASRC